LKIRQIRDIVDFIRASRKRLTMETWKDRGKKDTMVKAETKVEVKLGLWSITL